MSKIKNGRLDQYGAEPFKQQHFGTAGVEEVKSDNLLCMLFARKTADGIAIVEQSHCLWLLVGVLIGSLFI